ncbi:TonB-dependent receptor plug domain-containing protein [Azonexus sp. IMCC34839]|uniref:TonB-dependent receptor plug domain-containing protein n=1 Tax=Azonexus sp. IMCC34839 TaxID=3133695 RepID=UPI00399A2572
MPVKVSSFFLRYLLAIAAAAPTSVFAENESDSTLIPLEQLVDNEVVPASKLARQVSDSPSAVSIVTAADIRAYGYRTLADVINGMRGLYTTYDHRYEYMGGRGFGIPGDYAGRILVLIDGYATQDSLFSQAYIDQSGLLDLEMVERVEYVPGTGSATYGNNAMLGIINVITRKGGDFDAMQVSGEIASHGGRKQRVSLGKRLDNGADVLLSASTLDVSGRNWYFPAYDTPSTNNGVAEHQDGEHNKRVFGKFSHEGLTVEGAYVDRAKRLPTNPSSYAAFNTPFRVRDENAFLNVSYDTDLSLRLSSASRFYLGSYDYSAWREYAYQYYSVDNQKYGERAFKAKWWGVDQKLISRHFDDQTIVLGVEFRSDYQQKFRWRYLTPVMATESQFQEAYSRRIASFYLTDEYRFNHQWSVNFGARYDDASNLKGNLSPRLALIYRPSFQTTWKASYSEAFRMPNADDYATYGSAAKPEYVAASELVLQHQFSQGFRFTGSLYQYRRTHQLIYDDDAGDYVAAGTSKTRGIEAEIERIWDNGVRFRSSIAFQNARDTEGRHLVNSPWVLAKGNLTFLLPGDQVRTGIETRYIGGRETLERRRLGGFALTDLTFSSERKWLGFSASLSIRNLFDRKHEVVSPFDWRPDSGVSQDSLLLDGRAYWLQLNYDL